MTPVRSLIVALALAGAALPASAAQRHFVASTGVDSNPCSITAPCRSFAAAAALVNPDGEILVQDTAGYGSVTVTKPLSIISPSGVYAGISVFAGTDGVTINAPGGSVKLAGLWINGQGGAAGIKVQQAARVTVEGVSVTNMAAEGFLCTASGARIAIRNSVFRDNAAAGIAATGASDLTIDGVHASRNGGAGIAIVGGRAEVSNSVTNDNASTGLSVTALAATQASAAVRDHTSADNAANGIAVSQAGTGQAAVTISRAALTGNATNGVSGQVGGTGTVRVTVSDSQLTGNGVAGITSDGATSLVYVHGNTITDNPVGVQGTTSGQVTSVGNNSIVGNGADTGTGYSTYTPK